MDRASVTSGAAFKAAVRSTLVLIVVLLVSCAAAFSYLRHEMMAAVRTQIIEDQIVLTQIFADDGLSGVVDAMDLFRRPLPTRLRAVGLFDATGNTLAGNFTTAPDFLGWRRKTVYLSQPGAPDAAVDYYLNVSLLHGFVMVVGRDLALVDLQERRMVQGMVLIGVLVSVTSLAIGYVASLQSLQKLERMAGALDRFSKGDTAVRLETSALNDQIDRIAGAMNVHLNRLSGLMATTRASAAALAHDLRTPLARAFLSVDQALQRMDAGQDPRAAVEEVEGELARLRSIFDAILRISRLERPGDLPPFGRVQIAPLLADVVETFGPVAEDKGQTLALDPVPPDLAAVGDAAMLAQVLANLVQNAVTHCPPGALIRLSAGRAGAVVRLCVADNGPGIPPADRDRVFDLFHQGEMHRGGPGNGLGLALVKAIVERLGATVTLGDAGPGLRVDVDLPAAPPIT